MANRQMNFSVGIKTTYDAAGINKLKADLTSLANISTNKSFLAPMTEQIPQAIKAANTLRTAITQAYNPKLGTSTIDRFNKSIAKSGMSLKEVQAGLHQFGVQGDMAFVSATSNLLRMDSVARNTNTTFDKMFTTLKNTITWGLSSALWNNMTGSIQKAYYYVRDLDTALNDIRIVTGKSNEEMADFAKNANEAAKALGTSTRNYTEGSLIYYQQGLSDEEVKTRTDITAKTALVTGQSMDQVSEQLTAVWNGYKVSAEEAELYIDRLAAVAATTASDLEELSTGMSKVASAAANLGVSESQLSAILATTISVTRQAPENVGTAYKTIFARISDIKAGLDTETTFGNYTSKMAEMGISVLDATGNLRDMGEVIEEIGAKWASMTREQQISLAQTMAGTRQYNNLVALFDNWSNYEETLHTAENAAGTLAEQHNIALDSINNRLNILKATWEDLYQNLISSDDIKTLVSSLTDLVQVLANVVKTVGGLKTILPGVAGLFLQLGSARIGKELGAYINDFTRIGESAKIAALEAEKFENALKQSLSNNNYDVQVSEKQQESINSMISYYREISQYKSIMTAEDEKTYNELLKQQEALTKIELEYEQIRNNVKNVQNNNFGLIKPTEQESYKYLTQEFNFGSLIENEDVEKINRVSSTLTTLITEMNSLSSDSAKAEQSVHTLNDTLEYMYENTGASRGQLEGLQDKLEEYINNADNAAEGTKRFIDFLKQMRDTASATAEGINQTASEMEILETKKNSFKNFLNTKQIIEDVSSLAGVFSSLAMTISGVSSVVKVLNDDTLSTGEKILRILTSVGFLLPAIITSTKNVLKFYNQLKTISSTINGLKLAESITDKKITNETREQVILDAKITKEKEKQLALETAIAAQKKAEQEFGIAAEADKKYSRLSERVHEATNKLQFGGLTPGQEKYWKNAQKISKQEMEETARKANEARQRGSQYLKEAEDAKRTAQNAENDLNSLGNAGNKGLVGLIASAPQAAAAIAIIVAALAAIVGGMALVEDHQKKIVQKNLNELKNLKELNDARQEEATKLNDLVSSYTNLKTQLDEGTITERDYRNQVLALTENIEDQRIKLALLRGEYDTFGETLQKVMIAQNEELIQGYDAEIRRAESTMSAAKVQGTNLGQDIWKYFTGGVGAEVLIPLYGQISQTANVFKGIGTNNQVISKSSDLAANNEFKNYVARNEDLKNFLKTGGPGGYQLHIEDNDIVAAYEAIDKAITDNAHLANTETIKELTTIRDNMKEAYDIRKEAENQRNELIKKNLVYAATNDADSINSAKDYSDRVAQLAKEAIKEKVFGEDEYEEARIWANGALSAISDEAREWSKSNAIKDSLIESLFTEDWTQDQLDQLYSLLGQYSDAELKLLLPVFFTFGQDSAENFIEGYKKDIDKYLNSKDSFVNKMQGEVDKQNINSALSLANENKTFDTKETRELLKNTELNNDEFWGMEFGNQMITALWTQAEAGIRPEEAEALAKEYEKDLENAKSLLEEKQKEVLDEFYNEDQPTWQLAANFSYIDDNGEEVLAATKEELEDLQLTYVKSGNSVDGFTAKQKALYDLLVEKGFIDKEAFEQINITNNEYLKVNDNVENLIAKTLELEGSTRDWSRVQQQAAEYLKQTNGQLDELQSGYKTLSQATKEWNLNEGFSIDTLQNLVNMNPQYLRALEMNGNQLKINTETLNEVARAEANVAVNEWEEARAAEIMAAAQDGSNSAAYRKVEAMHTLAGSIQDVTAALWDAVDAEIAFQQQQGNLSLEAAANLSNWAKESQKDAALMHNVANKVDVTKDDKKGSKSSKKDEKDYKDEFDRYWEFIKAIEKVGDAIDQLNKKEKNLYGQEKISLLKNKNDLLKQQVKTYNDLYEEQKREQSELMGALSGKGVTFNAEGEITNYAKRTSEALAQYNAAVAAYNAGTLSETAFKTAEKAYENFKKEIDRYDKLYYDEMKDTMDKIDDINREVLANNLSAWEIEIKLKIDWESLQREWIDFLSDINEDFTRVYADLSADLEKSLKKATTYTEQSGTLDTDLQAIYDVMREIDKLEAGGKSDMFESISQAQEKLKTLNTDLMKDSEALYKLWQDAYKTYLEGIDQLNDKFEEQMGYYKRIDKELQHQKNLIGLLYGDEAYQMMETLYRNQEKNQLAEIDSLRRQRDLWEEQWKKADEGSQEQLKYYQLMTEAQDNLNDSVEDYIKLLQDDATNAINNILNNYDNWLSNGQGLDTLKADWDDLSDYIDKYYDSVESVYHIENLALKIREGIDEQDSVANQKKLQDLYDKEITYLKEKENLTEYDIKAAEQRYNIALKEIALQDAQDAKNSMKVTRDTNGNWTYQYVADTEEEDKKRQELSDEIYKLYELANNAYNQNLSDLMSLQEEYLARMKEIELEEIKTGKDMTAERDKLNQWYFDNYERLSEENLDYQRDMANAGTGVLKAAYENKVYDLTDFTETQKKLIEEATNQNIQDFESLSKSVEENISGLGDLTLQMLSETVPEWTAGAREMADAWNADDGVSIKSQVVEATEEIIDTIVDYQESLDELEETAGVDFDLIIDTINDTTDATEDLKDMVEELCDTNDLDNYRDAVDDLANAWYGVKDAIRDAIREIEIYLQKLGQSSKVSVSTNIPTAGGGTPGNSGNGNNNNNNNDIDETTPTTGYWWSINSSGDAVIGEVGSDKVYATIGRKSDARRAGEGIKRYGMATFKDTSESAAYLERASREGLLEGISYEDLTRNLSSWFKNIPKLNTGGYTGDWLNGDGRLAILHKKELVLNEADTANFLSAVGMIREIASFGTSIEDNIAFGLASFMDKFSGGISVNGKGNTDNSKQNIFNINAPITSTATTDEIQRAIIELPNLASQYAARNAF